MLFFSFFPFNYVKACSHKWACSEGPYKGEVRQNNNGKCTCLQTSLPICDLIYIHACLCQLIMPACANRPLYSDIPLWLADWPPARVSALLQC